MVQKDKPWLDFIGMSILRGDFGVIEFARLVAERYKGGVFYLPEFDDFILKSSTGEWFSECDSGKQLYCLIRETAVCLARHTLGKYPGPAPSSPEQCRDMMEFSKIKTYWEEKWGVFGEGDIRNSLDLDTFTDMADLVVEELRDILSLKLPKRRE